MMKRSLSISLWLVSAVGTAVLLALLGMYGLSRPSLQVVQTWQQPASVSYPDGATHYLSVVEGERDWRGFPLNMPRRYFVYVGLESGTPSHGHVIDFTFYPGKLDPTESIPAVIRESTVEWTPAGVSLQTASGHQLFIPAEMFMGGR